MTLIDELRLEFGTIEGDPWAARAARLMLAGSEGDVIVQTFDGPNRSGTARMPAILFEVDCFEGGPIRLAVHHSLRSPDGVAVDAELWTVTEAKSGRGCAVDFYLAHEALMDAIMKLALSIASDGRDAFDRLVQAQTMVAA